MNRANLVVPASKAARSKIARNRNGTANSASAKNKAEAANRAVAAKKAVINTEASSKAGDRSSYTDYSTAGGISRRLFVRVPIAFSSKLYYKRRIHTARFGSHQIEHKG
jgi:hypothetical protein